MCILLKLLTKDGKSHICYFTRIMEELKISKIIPHTWNNIFFILQFYLAFLRNPSNPPSGGTGTNNGDESIV